MLYRKPHQSAVDPATGELFDDLLVIRTANPDDKQALVDGGARSSRSTTHGYNAVLVQLSASARSPATTRRVITDAWLAVAPKKLVEEFLA